MSDGLPVVLIVDDDEEVRKALARLVRTAGFAAETFASAESFLGRGLQGLRGCVVLDVRLPHMSGPELQQHLSAMGSPLPVIMMTAHEDDDVRERAMRSGAVAFIQKPFDDCTLLSAVRAAVGHGRS